MNPKQAAGQTAMQFISSGMNVGLGTGSTTDFFLMALGEAIRSGKLRDIRGVPTSVRSEKRAQELGIPLVELRDVPYLDVAVDGADEIDPNLNLIKGAGGALLREKIIAQAAKKFVVIADDSKRVNFLGEKFALPVEVTPFAHDTHDRFFKSLGAEAKLRQGVITDNGNVIYDLRFARIDDPASLEMKLLKRAGVVDTGLFIGIASVAIVAGAGGVEMLNR